jgi:hypothetical protein
MWGTGLAGCLLRARRPEEAIEQARLAFLRSRDGHMAKVIEAVAAHDLGRHDEAREALAIARRTNPRLTSRHIEHFLGSEAANHLRPLWPPEERLAVAGGA